MTQTQPTTTHTRLVPGSSVVAEGRAERERDVVGTRVCGAGHTLAGRMPGAGTTVGAARPKLGVTYRLDGPLDVERLVGERGFGESSVPRRTVTECTQASGVEGERGLAQIMVKWMMCILELRRHTSARLKYYCIPTLHVAVPERWIVETR